ncbi:MAG: 6-carboxytetrahydropterin synthase [Planctomycetota bacterium]
MSRVVEITRRAEFSASHRLCNPRFTAEENERVYGKCANPNGHGHNYVVDVTLRGPVDPRTGMLIDLKLLKEIVEREVITPMDHRHLNEDVFFLEGVIPTAENLAIAIWERLAPHLPENLLWRVRLWETARNYVDYYGENEQGARRA